MAGMANITGLELRLVGLNDAAWVADAMTAARPDEPYDAETLRWEWTKPQAGWFRERTGVLAGGRPLGFAELSHPPWEEEPEQVARCDVWFAPSDVEAAGEVLERLESRAGDEGARVMAIECWADEEGLIGVLERRAYRFDRSEKAWQLDLVANREALLAHTDECRARMERQNLQLVTLASWADRDRWDKLTALHGETMLDIPHTVPIHPWRREEIVAEFTNNPRVLADRVWLALDGDRLAGVSYLAYPPQRGNVWTEYTGVARAYRGRGVARAVKMETLAQAIGLGVGSVRTANDEQNAAILHINEALAYQPITGFNSYLKPLR